MSKRKQQTTELAEVERPDFDFVDMICGFPLAVALAHGNIPAAGLCVVGFVTQKSVRTNPELLTQAADFATALLPMRITKALPAPKKGLPEQAGEVLEKADTTAGIDEPLFQKLSDTIHELYIGYTGGGKTTLMHEQTRRRAEAGHPVLVLDPDASPGQWPGCRVVGGGDKFGDMRNALLVVEQQIKKRRSERAEGRREFPLMYVVLDEVQDTLGAVPEALPLIETMLRRGRKIGVRVMLGVQDKQVKTLGLEGKSELLGNLTRIKVRKQADGQRTAEIDFNNGDAPVVQPIPKLRDPESLIIERVQTKATALPAPDPDLLLSSLLQNVPEASQSQENTSSVPVTVPNISGNGNGNTATVTVGNGGGVVNVYAQAVSSGRSFNRRQAAGPNIRKMRQRAAASHRKETIQQTYARLRASGVTSFRKAYAQAGGNRDEALAAWQAAAPKETS